MLVVNLNFNCIPTVIMTISLAFVLVLVQIVLGRVAVPKSNLGRVINRELRNDVNSKVLSHILIPEYLREVINEDINYGDELREECARDFGKWMGVLRDNYGSGGLGCAK
jgi:hypothetical protein